jgi:hypothetical protein
VPRSCILTTAYSLIQSLLKQCGTTETLAPTFPIPFHVPKLCTSDIFTLTADQVTFASYPFQGPLTELEFNLRELLPAAIHAAGIPIVAEVFKVRRTHRSGVTVRGKQFSL